LIYNTELRGLELYSGSEWVTIGADSVFIPPAAPNYSTTEIQAALTAGKTVLLSGSYNIKTTVTIPDTASLIGVNGGASISFYPTGDTPVDDYMLECTGSSRKTPAIENIYLSARNKGRGVHFDQVRYSPLFRNLRVNGTIGVGIDCIDTWGSYASGAYLISCKGISMRLWRANSSNWQNINISSAIDSDWPSASETILQDGAAANVQTAEARRAALVIADNTDLTEFFNLILESNALGAKPIACIDSAVCTLRNVRLESNNSSDACISVLGDGHREGSVFGIDGCRFIYTSGTPTLVDLTGTTRSCNVNRLLSLNDTGNDLTDSVIRLTSGTHYNPTVTNSYVRVAEYVENVAATLTRDKSLVVGTMADTAAPVSTIYYSSTQSSLAFKDSAGTVVTIDTTAIA
jgi:hypothetical protein